MLEARKTFPRHRVISELPEQDREAILYNIDALLRDAKTRLAYK